MTLIKSSISEEFDAFSKNYRNDMIAVVPHYEDLLNAYMQAIPADKKINHVLDIGCGNGTITELLQTKYPDAAYTLIDASIEMLNICRIRLAELSVDYVQTYFNEYVFPEDRYDIAVAGFSLHHCQAQEKRLLYQKVFRSLAADGIFVMSDLFIGKGDEDHPALIAEWKTHVLNHDRTGRKWAWLSEHYAAFDYPDNLKNVILWLEQAGFAQIEIVWQQGHWINLKAIK